MSDPTWSIRLHPENPVDVSSEDIFKNDFLKFEASVVRLTALMGNIEPPFTIGIYGDWGSGKTSFMKMLKANMDKESFFETFWFDAWEYENEASLLLPLLSKMAQGRDEPLKGLMKTVKKIAAGVVLSGAGIAARLATVGAIGLDDIEKNLTSYEEKVEALYENWIDQIDKLKHKFTELTNAIVNDKKALVIFIDDLDRCLPENVVKLIENVKHFLSVKGNRCIFVIGVDKKVLEKGIEARYGTNLISGSEYLRKIINLSFDVPKCDSANKEFILETARVYAGTEWYKENEAKIATFADFFMGLGISNPREIKPIILRYLIFLTKSDSDEYIPEVIIQLLVYREKFTVAYNQKKEKNLVFYFPALEEKIPNSKENRSLKAKEISENSCDDFGEIGTNDGFVALRETDLRFRVKFQEASGDHYKHHRKYFDLIDFLYSLS